MACNCSHTGYIEKCSCIPYSRNVCDDYILRFVVENEVCGFNVCSLLDKSCNISSLWQQQTLCHGVCSIVVYKVFWIQSTDATLLGLVTASAWLSISFKCQSRVLLSKWGRPRVFVLATCGICTLFWCRSCKSAKCCFFSRRAVDSGSVKCRDALVGPFLAAYMSMIFLYEHDPQQSSFFVESFWRKWRYRPRRRQAWCSRK